MKAVFQTLVFQLSCIVIFGFVYWYCQDDFTTDSTERKYKKGELIDYLFMSTTIQAGVGYGDLYPINFRSKFILILQQFLMISSNVLILFLFSKHLIKHHKKQ
jgi:hypothetical protein